MKVLTILWMLSARFANAQTMMPTGSPVPIPPIPDGATLRPTMPTKTPTMMPTLIHVKVNQDGDSTVDTAGIAAIIVGAALLLAFVGVKYCSTAAAKVKHEERF